MITKNELKKMSKKELLRALELATNTPDLFINATKDLQPPVKYDEPKTIIDLDLDNSTIDGVPLSEFAVSSPPDSNPSPSSDPVLSGSDSSENPVQE